MTRTAHLSAEWKSNPRLRGGVWLMLAILWYYGAILLQDRVDEQARELAAVTKRTARIEALTGQAGWQERAAEAQAQERRLAGQWYWNAQTQGLAQAALQDWLNQAVQQLGISKPQISVAAQDGPRRAGDKGGAGGGPWKVSARLACDFNPRTFAALMRRISENPQKITVETLNVRSVSPPRMEMLLVAHFSPSTE